MHKYVKGGAQCAHPGPNRFENGSQSIHSEAFIPGNDRNGNSRSPRSPRNQKLAKIGLKTDCEFEPICEGW